jgi:predicted transcriptional regulator
VENQGLIIKEAAASLGINYSTAKTILQLYKKTGRIDKIETVPNMRITPVNMIKDRHKKSAIKALQAS